MIYQEWIYEIIWWKHCFYPSTSFEINDSTYCIQDVKKSYYISSDFTLNKIVQKHFINKFEQNMFILKYDTKEQELGICFVFVFVQNIFLQKNNESNELQCIKNNFFLHHLINNIYIYIYIFWANKILLGAFW